MKSIEKQLNLSLAASILLIFLIFWWLSVFTIHHLTEDYILTRLEHDTLSIEKHLNRSGQGNQMPAVDYDAINPIYAQPDSGHYFVIQLGDHLLKSLSLTDYPLYLKKSPYAISHYETKGPAESTLLVRRFVGDYQGQPMILYVAEDHSPIQRTLKVFDIMVGLFALITLALLYLSQRHLLRKGFKRLEPIQVALANLQKGEATQLDPADYPSEVSELINSLNQAILSASTQLQKSRQSNANLAHSLKTPLNLIYQLLEDPALTPHAELKATLKDQAQKIRARIESELQKARLASDTLSVQPFSLSEHLPDLMDSLQQLYPQTRFQLKGADTPDAHLPMEKEDGFELLGNLLDNAAKFGHGEVFIDIHSDMQPAVIIEDNGDGVPTEQLDAIQTRGHRLDESVDGHGIGLSIVKQIAEAYHVTMQFDTSKHGGLKVTLTF
jgi:signal transduction histidine kinase